MQAKYKNELNYDIDFVITWVDNTDPVWVQDFKHFKSGIDNSFDTGKARYRDWQLLKYWFRGVEKYAPWVRSIHFITYGHVPSWLNVNHPKIKVVRHEDYIPKQYLPLFNSAPIELMINKIPDLAEHFVYFNDDFFLLKPISPQYFFHNGKPCDMAVINISHPHNIMEGRMQHNMAIIRQEFGLFKSVIKHPTKWFRLRYGKYLINTFRGLFSGVFLSPGDTHAPQPYLKETWDKVWLRYGSQLEITMHHRFRCKESCSHWLFRYWQLMKGDFLPFNVLASTKCFYNVEEQLDSVCQVVESQEYAVAVINDTESIVDIDHVKNRISQAFENILSDESSFEE